MQWEVEYQKFGLVYRFLQCCCRSRTEKKVVHHRRDDCLLKVRQKREILTLLFCESDDFSECNLSLQLVSLDTIAVRV